MIKQNHGIFNKDKINNKHNYNNRLSNNYNNLKRKKIVIIKFQI